MNLQWYGTRGIVLFTIKAAIPILILFLLFEVRGIGAGDIKLLSVLSSMVGCEISIRTFGLSVIVASIVVIILCIKEKKIIRRKLHYSYYIAAAYFILQLKEEIRI